MYIINSISCTGTLHVFTDHVDDIIASLFQYLKMLRETGPKDWIFKEVQVCVCFSAFIHWLFSLNPPPC